MKPIKYLLFLSVAAFAFAPAASAQEESVDDGPPQQWQRRDNPLRDIRNNALRQLGLSNEQIEQIRRINIDRRAQMEAAQKRLKEANRALDAAIYADVVNDSEVQTRLAEVNAAQNDVAKMRFMNELAVRRILTHEQLVRFREIRQRFEEERQEFQKRRRLQQQRFRQRRNNRMKDSPGE